MEQGLAKASAICYKFEVELTLNNGGQQSDGSSKDHMSVNIDNGGEAMDKEIPPPGSGWSAPSGAANHGFISRK